jgi:YD repeat-containing protein
LGNIFLVLFLCGVMAVVIVAPYAGAISSGALFLLLPSDAPAPAQGSEASSVPLHKGYIDLGTGLYVRDEEDLVVRGTPPLVLRRTYRSRDRLQREFGVGTTHNGNVYLRGDGDAFQWAELVLPAGTRVRFNRVSPGTSYYNALYEHRSSPSEWQGARLGWTGRAWALRRQDGVLMVFHPCGGAGELRVCWIQWERDANDHRIDYRRDAAGRLLRMETRDDRWIAFEYSSDGRVSRVSESGGRNVRYEYDMKARLIRASANDGREDRYEYTDNDEMATVVSPEMRIQNTYQSGRCVRQDDYFSDTPEPYVFDVDYVVNEGAVAQVQLNESNGSWKRYVYGGATRYITAEIWGTKGYQPLTFEYQLDPVTSFVTSVTLTCPDRTGRPLRHSAQIRPETEEWVKQDLVRTNCSRRPERWRTPG